jgi:hypothetical protein
MLPDLFGWFAHFLNGPDPFVSQGYQSYTNADVVPNSLHTSNW